MRAALFLLCLPEFFRCLLYGIVIHQNLRRRDHLSHVLQFCLPVGPVETV